MSIIETHATVSHRYYMRKTKAEIVQRIRDMLGSLPKSVIERRFKSDCSRIIGGQPDPTFGSLVLFNLLHSVTPIGFNMREYTKYELAAAAMLAHELLGKVQAMPELTSCAADCDDMCDHPKCPQNRDGEPAKTGRHCPLHDPAWRDGDE